MQKSEALLLYQSIVDRDLELVDRLIESRDLEYLNSVRFGEVFDITLPIEVAIESGNLPVVIRILEMGEDPSKGMGEAVCQGDPNIVKVLLDAGAKIEDSHELLSREARSGNLEIMKLLIEGGAEIDSYDLDNDVLIYPLVISISHGYIQIHQYLLQNLTVKSAEILNIVSLQEVATVGEIKVMKFLLDRGINIDSMHYLWGCTALIAAVAANKWYISHSALQFLRHILVTKTRQCSDTTDRNRSIAAT